MRYLLSLLAACTCAACSSAPAAKTVVAPHALVEAIESNEPPVGAAVRTSAGPSQAVSRPSAPQEQSSSKPAEKQPAAAHEEASVGVISAFKASTVTLFSTETASNGETVAADQIEVPVSVHQRSDVNLRLRIHTAQGDRWVAPSQAQFSSYTATRQPTIRLNSPTAAGRGISD